MEPRIADLRERVAAGSAQLALKSLRSENHAEVSRGSGNRRSLTNQEDTLPRQKLPLAS